MGCDAYMRLSPVCQRAFVRRPRADVPVQNRPIGRAEHFVNAKHPGRHLSGTVIVRGADHVEMPALLQISHIRSSLLRGYRTYIGDLHGAADSAPCVCDVQTHLYKLYNSVKSSDALSHSHINMRIVRWKTCSSPTNLNVLLNRPYI